MLNQTNKYPLSFNVDYKNSYNRLTTFFRLFMVIPAAALFIILTSSASLIIIPTILTLLFQKKYPKWWFDFNVALTQFSTRIWCYAILLTDEYPSVDQDQSVHLSFKYPNTKKDLNRFLPLIKWFLAIPHYVVLLFLLLAGIILTIIAWFSIIFTKKYPRSIFDFQISLLTWGLRVQTYAFFLITDKYPPFSLK
jgi:hypothetical protein